MPDDAEFKGYQSVIVQEIVIKTDNVEYSIISGFTSLQRRFFALLQRTMNFSIQRILGDIFLAGLLSTDYQQIDDTGSRVRGQNYYAQIAKFAAHSIPLISQRRAKTG